jgi:hypothetical protein
MNVEIGAEAALFPEKEYINGIAVAVFDKFLYLFLGFKVMIPWAGGAGVGHLHPEHAVQAKLHDL